MNTYRVDRPGEDPEYYSTWVLALAREKLLRFKGVTQVVAWEQCSAIEPVVTTKEAS